MQSAAILYLMTIVFPSRASIQDLCRFVTCFVQSRVQTFPVLGSLDAMLLGRQNLLLCSVSADQVE